MAILFIGVALRVGFIFYHGLSNDELSAWARLDVNSLSELWHESVMLNDMHPALYQTFLYLWSGMFGESDWVLRLPAILFFIGTSCLIYNMGRKYLSEWSGIFGVLGLALFTFPIIHTTFTRPYVTGLFFTVLLVYAIRLFIDSQKKFSLPLLFIIIGISGAMYSHYFALVTVAVISFVSLFYIPKQKISAFIIAGLIGVALFLPHIEITKFHLSRGGLQWLGAPKNDWIFTFFEKFLNDSSLLLVFFSFVALFIAFAFKKKMSKISKHFLLLFVSVYIVGHAISVLYTPVLRFNVLLFSIPFLFLSFGHLFERMKEHHRYLLVGFIVIGVSCHTLFFSKLFSPQYFPVFKEIAQGSAEYNIKNGTEDITYFGNFNNPRYFTFYYTPENPQIDFKMDSLSVMGQLNPLMEEFHEKVKEANTNELGMLQSNMLMTPLHNEIIRQYYPNVKKFDSYLLSSFEVYNKEKRKEHQYNFSKNLVTWKNQTEPAQDFIGDFCVTAGKIYKQTASSKDSYVVFEVSGKLGENELLMVAVAEREGKIIQQKNGDNVFYQVQDMSMNIFKEDRYFLPYRIPEGLKDSDEIKMYIWNPNKDSIHIEKPKLYVVDPSK